MEVGFPLTPVPAQEVVFGSVCRSSIPLIGCAACPGRGFTASAGSLLLGAPHPPHHHGLLSAHPVPLTVKPLLQSLGESSPHPLLSRNTLEPTRTQV